jgi:carbonic anhydrase
MPKRYKEELESLIVGYSKFRERYLFKDFRMFTKLATHGQHPKTMFISCSDSRVDPYHILNCEPGDIFVFRNVANLVPHYEDRPKNEGIGAALEFAVRILKVQQIIVLGHSHCGGIKALMESDTAESKEKSPSLETQFIKDWVKVAAKARDKVFFTAKHLSPEQQAKELEEQALLVSYDNLKTYPWIHEAMEAQKLAIHLWRFDLREGKIKFFDFDSKVFEDLPSKYDEKSKATSATIANENKDGKLLAKL